MKAFEDVIIKPVLTEKTYATISDKRYCFVVDRKGQQKPRSSRPLRRFSMLRWSA